mmetsp:Transcript_132441/g.382860  ORF Transcript_132441/g.382860 Transcript_132441/m.382860 type:complete len:207 (+) Transcript_132441:920-1540(+)
MGQGMPLLQSLNSTPPPGSHEVPPFAAVWRTPRVRFLEPVLHDLEHSPHGSQVPQTQSTGQAKSLQTCKTMLGPMHNAPLPLCGTSTARLRSRAPPPHVTLHSLLIHGPQTQSTSHACVLHRFSSADSPAHWAPPCSASVRSLLRCDQPPPHFLSHSLQAPQLCHSQLTGHNWKAHVRVSAPSFKLHVTPSPPEAYTFSVRFRCST